MGSDSDDDDAQADFDLELNRKVATVMQPLMKKLKKQEKRIDKLEELSTKQGQVLAEKLPTLEQAIQALRREHEEALDRTRRDLGERVLHADHARVEVGLREQTAALQSALEETRQQAIANEVIAKSLQSRLDDAEAAAKRSTAAAEERVAGVRMSLADEVQRADARRSELQLHMAEMSARLHAELKETR